MQIPLPATLLAQMHSSRPAASTEFKKGVRYIVPAYLGKGSIYQTSPVTGLRVFRLVSSILQITPWSFVHWDLTLRYCPLLSNFLLPDSSFPFPFGFWFFWLKTCQGYQRLSPPPFLLICSLFSSLFFDSFLCSAPSFSPSVFLFSRAWIL